MGSPAISVLVPIYNVDRYLRDCLDSIRAQSFTDIEVLCLNDGSTDGSRDIILEFCAEDPRFVLIDKSNSGYGATMNLGLAKARGEYIAIVESDDFIEPTAFHLLHEAIRGHDADFAKSNFFLHWSHPEARSEFFENIPARLGGEAIDPVEVQEVFSYTPSIWAALYRKSFLERNRIGFLETPGASFQDSSFVMKSWICASRVSLLHEAFVHYRQDNAASSVNSREKVDAVPHEYEEIERFLKLRPDRAAVAPAVMAMKYRTYLWNYERINEEFRMGFLARLSGELRRHLDAGEFDLAALTPWEQVEARMVLHDPQRFHELRNRIALSQRPPGRLLKAGLYLRLGGPVLLVSAAARSFKRRLSARS